MKIGFHASHEQFAPSRLLKLVQQAEDAGFDAAMCSDHIHPWSNVQGESGFAWSWLGAALHATKFSFGVVNAPGQRYHPAIIAQAVATLNEMFPERQWIAVGSGQALNEHITGEKWPKKRDRNARLKECVEVMRALWRGETVLHDGLVTVENAKLYSLPEKPPMITGAAVTAKTATWMAPWVDGLITVSRSNEKLKGVVKAFRENGGADKPLFLQSKHAWAPDHDEALRDAHEQWRTNLFASKVLSDFEMPEQFEKASKYVRPEDVQEKVRVSAEPGQHAEWLDEFFELGFDEVYLHNVGTNQEAFIDAFGKDVLPQFQTSEAA
ncbi:MAG: TIGR03885 family FMN-dependent LLM class oxidoreductase [Rhodothermales bacterium]